MKSNYPLKLKTEFGNVRLTRDTHSLFHIHGDNLESILYGQGWAHAQDRQIQLFLQRLIATGTMAQHLGDKEELIAIDTFIRKMNFAKPAEREAENLSAEHRHLLHAYCAGINRYLEDKGSVWEWKLLGYRPDPWKPEHTLAWGRAFTYLGLSMTQGDMEKLIIQMVQNNVPDKAIRELFPNLTDPIDRTLLKKITLAPPPIPKALEWLARLPSMTASNNWAVSGKKTASGSAMLCGDPHLEINRIPGIWYELFLHLPERTLCGAGIPGFPGIMAGHNGAVAWSPTYSFTDMLDFRIEECAGGKYRRGKNWKPFIERKEIIRTKKGRTIETIFHENEHGILEGDPHTPGHYLVAGWTCYNNGGGNDIGAVLNLLTSDTVKEAVRECRKFEVSNYNWVAADIQGNIGYTMSGRCPKRPSGVSGLMALPGWEKKYNTSGYVASKDLPSLLNPPEGYIVTANNDMNRHGKYPVINLPMAPYRADRITALLKKKSRHTINDMKSIQLDLYSLQAARLMKIISPHLPNTAHGTLLKKWDCVYRNDTIEPALFEAVYTELIKTVFGQWLGTGPVTYILDETSIMNAYFNNIDEILLKKKSAWFGTSSKAQLIQKAIERGLKKRPKKYGATRKIIMKHLLFGDLLPSWMGFNPGPFELPGSRATPCQGQIFQSAGRVTTFAPSYRIVADMGTHEIHSAAAGGISDRRFSPLYTKGIEEWHRGIYKILAIKDQ